MEYSIGEMVDKLAVVHLKIWHLEEEISAARDNGLSDKEIENLCDQVVNLNTIRNKIVASINKKLS